MNKVGLHIHSLQPEVYQALVTLMPPGAILLNPTPQWIEDIRSVMGNEFYIGVRKYEDGVPFWERVPEDWADELAAMCGSALHMVNGAITYNEPMPQGHDNPEHFPLFDNWQARTIRRLQDVHGLDGLAFPFGTGQFTAAPDRVRLDVAFPESCEVCRILAPHDYDWPDIFKSEGYRALRWLAWLNDIEEAGHGRKQVIVSEWGLTQATYGGPDVGWRSGVSPDDYVGQIDKYNARVCPMTEVKFFAPFNWGGIPFGWESFEHVQPGDSSVVDRIFMIKCPGIPGNGGGKVIIKDIDGTMKDEQWLHDVWGITIQRPVVPQGQMYFRLAVVEIEDGICAILNNVKTESGDPIVKQLVAFHWPSAPNPPESGEPPYETPVYDHDWMPKSEGDGGFVFGPTNEEGNWAGAMGKGAMVNEGGEGPHWCWIHHPTYLSECPKGLGWRTGTNHMTARLYWVLTKAGGEPTPPNGGEEMFVETSRKHTTGVEKNRAIINVVGEHNFLDTRASLYVEGADPDLFPDPFDPESLTRYNIEMVYTPGQGETERTFIVVIHPPSGSPELGSFEFKFFTGEKREYEIAVEWKEGGEPTPPPTPPGEGIVSELRTMGSRLLAIATELEQADIIAEDIAEDMRELADIL